jgi:hypothetical protein
MRECSVQRRDIARTTLTLTLTTSTVLSKNWDRIQKPISSHHMVRSRLSQTRPIGVVVGTDVGSCSSCSFSLQTMF